jgi:hypothetical protein
MGEEYVNSPLLGPIVVHVYLPNWDEDFVPPANDASLPLSRSRGLSFLSMVSEMIVLSYTDLLLDLARQGTYHRPIWTMLLPL